MKKILLTFFVLAFVATENKAQDEKGHFGISIGPSIPLGDFASKDYDNEEAGLARTGIMYDISFAHKLGAGNFGITALLRGQANPTDAKVIAKELANLGGGVNWTVESDAWSLGGLFLGGYGSFPISDKASFDTRAMIGFVSAGSPEVTITGTGPGGTAWVKQSSEMAGSFAFLLGAGFKFDITNKVYLLTNLDYMGSKPEFRDVEITASDGTRLKETYSQSFTTLNLSFGIALKI